MGTYPEFIDPYDRSSAGLFVRLEHLARYLFAAEFAGRRKLRRALDCACGDGYGCRELARRAGAVTGVDANPSLIAAARSREEMPSAAKTEYIEADLNAGLGMLDGASFDIAACFETLEHIGRDRELLQEFRRVLRPGGYLLLSAPKAGYEPADEAGRPENPYHLRLYTTDGLASLLEETGFSVERALGQPYSNVSRVRMEDYVRDSRVPKETVEEYFNESPESLRCFAKVWAWPVEELRERSNTLFMVARRKR